MRGKLRAWFGPAEKTFRLRVRRFDGAMRTVLVRRLSWLRPAAWRPKAVISDSPGRGAMGSAERMAVTSEQPGIAAHIGSWRERCSACIMPSTGA